MFGLGGNREKDERLYASLKKRYAAGVETIGGQRLSALYRSTYSPRLREAQVLCHSFMSFCVIPPASARPRFYVISTYEAQVLYHVHLQVLCRVHLLPPLCEAQALCHSFNIRGQYMSLSAISKRLFACVRVCVCGRRRACARDLVRALVRLIPKRVTMTALPCLPFQGAWLRA